MAGFARIVPDFPNLRDGETTIIMKFSLLGGGGPRGQRGKSSKSADFFRGKRRDNKILKVQILLSRNFVVIAQAPERPTREARAESVVLQGTKTVLIAGLRGARTEANPTL